MKSATLFPLRIDSVASLIAFEDTVDNCGGARGAAGLPAGSHWQSAGMIKVAICPGALPAAAIASAVPPASEPELTTLRTQPETGVASETMSDVSGESAPTCQVVWSPIKFTIGERARRALCRFAIPFAKPGPR